MTCLDLSLDAPVALVRLANPSDATNALGLSFIQDLQQATAQACQDPAIKLIVFTGTGRSFSAGASLKEIDGADADEIVALLRAGQSLVRQILHLDVISIAAINGLTLGGFLELALACDIRWTHARGVFGLPESKLGLIPAWGGISLLWRTVPDSLCFEMLASGECISAHRAYEAGLVSRIFEGRDFEAAVKSEAKKLADRNEGVLRELKSLLKREKGRVNLGAADRSFLPLWNGRTNPVRPATIKRGDGSVQP